MKQIIKLLIFELIFLKFCFSDNLDISKEIDYSKFLREYNFSIFLGNKEIGFINIRISSFVNNEETGDFMFYSEINSYTEAPVLFFLGNTKTYEIEQYDNNFLPLNSTLITLENDKEDTTTITEIRNLDEEFYECIFKKVKKRSRIKKVKFKPPILTAGNAIPLVSTLWDFESKREIEFNFIDKENLNIDTIKFLYDGKTNQGLTRIRVILPYFNVRFNVYLDKDKNIVYAEGLGLRIFAKR